MQQHCTELTQKLLNSVDKEYNVVDMGAVLDVIAVLEKTTITKAELEVTRLGKHINEIRRQSRNVALAKRAKDLVRRWREMIQPKPSIPPSQPILSAVAAQTLNGTKSHSPGIRVAVPKPRSPPGIKNLKPQSPLLRGGLPLKALSPALSLNNDVSRSPNPTSLKQLPPTLSQNHRLNQPAKSPPILSSKSQNRRVEAVPRTHSANKRLRKDNSSVDPASSSLSPLTNDQCMRNKKPRINGEHVNINTTTNSQVPSPLPSNLNSNVVVINDGKNVNNDTGPKKRGRKKGSKTLKNQHLQEDRVKEKLASISRNPKLKTTQELLADLQARTSSTSVVNTGIGTGNNNNNRTITEPPTTEEILRGSDGNNSVYSRNSRTKLTKNSKSKSKTATTNGDDNIDIDNLDNDKKINISNNNNNNNNNNTTFQDLTVEEILAKLPPLDRDSIRWSDDEDCDELLNSCRRDVTNDDVDRLHNQCIEGLNGNYQLKLDDDAVRDNKVAEKTPDGEISYMERISGICRHRNDNPGKEFKEWHDMLARPSCDEQILHILPYVIID